MTGEKKYRIGLFTVSMEGDDFYSPLWKFINKQCIDLNMDLVVFPSKNLIIENDNQETYDVISEFFNPDLFDGLIFLTTTLINSNSMERLTKELEKFSKMPVVSIGVHLNLASSIIFDNYSGSSSLTDHLLTVHNFTKFGYLNGPKDQSECISRLKGVTDRLKKANLEIDKKNLFQGDFSNVGLEKILEPLLDRKEIDMDVLMCANDTMASKVIDILKDNGYSIPEDIAVTGFDNSSLATNQSPSITTINQPSEKVASEAVNTLYKMLNEGLENVTIINESELIINESCGCIKKYSTQAVCEINSWEKILKDSISNKDITFIKEIRKILYKISSNADILQLKYSVVNRFEELLCTNNKEELCFINKLYRELIFLFKDYEIKQNFKREYLKTRKQIESRDQYKKLLTSDNVQSLFDNIYNIFSDNKINTYYLLLNEQNDSEKMIKLIFAVNEGKKIDCRDTNCIFERTEFIPNNLLPSKNRVTLVSLPLFSLNKCFGHIILEVNDMNTSFYSEAQMNISSALMNILSLRELKDTQKLLIESEKMAFVGNLVTRLALEINKSFEKSVTSNTHLEYIIKQMLSENESTTNIKMESLLLNAKESSATIKKNITNAKKLINRFKKISADSDFELTKVFDLTELIENTFRKLNTEYKNIITNLELPPILFIDSYAGVYTEIIQNLFNNSIIHGFKESRGEINLKVSKYEDKVEIIYDDNGSGCSSIELSKIFNPFFTTKRLDGYSGLGLSIIYNLINKKLGGDIKVSMLDGKLTFIITVPI